MIAVIVGGLVYIKSQKTATVLPPMLNTETGQMVLVPGGPFQQGKEKKPDCGPCLLYRQDGSHERDVREVLRGDEPSSAAEVPERSPGRARRERHDRGCNSFAKWADKRLPTAVEWEKAARGTDGKTWPWGDANEAKFANVSDNPNFREHTLMPVNSMAGKRQSVRPASYGGQCARVCGRRHHAEHRCGRSLLENPESSAGA